MDKKYIIEKSKDTLKGMTKMQLIIATFIILIIAILAIFLLEFFHYNRLSNQIDTLSTNITLLENKFASTTNELREDISKNQIALSDTLKQNVGNLEQKLGDYSEQVGSVSNTVSTLQKLSKTDTQLLKKYSKVFFLNENYSPAQLFDIPAQYKYSDTKTLKFNAQVWPYLQMMIDEVNKTGISVYVFSAYRSFGEQQALKGLYTVTYGAGTANAFSADQGYSEHQLGTTVDLITKGLGGALDGFDSTKAYEWLQANAYRYGFILSYPKNNKYYVFEPWHWRFVGVKLATFLHNQDQNFYDLDQRIIDEYLISLFD